MSLDAVRNDIREIDEKLISLIAERQKLAAKVARLKLEKNLPIHDPPQQKAVLDRAFACAVKNRIDPIAVRSIFEILIDMNEERQRECSRDCNLP